MYGVCKSRDFNTWEGKRDRRLAWTLVRDIGEKCIEKK